MAMPDATYANPIQWRTRSLWSFILSCSPLLASLAASGCKCEGDANIEAKVTSNEELPLLEPANEPVDPESSCRPTEGAGFMLRARTEREAEPTDLEVSTGAFSGKDVEIIGTRGSNQTQAFYAYSTPGGSLKELDLGRLFGATEPPVAVRSGLNWLVLLRDSDATGVQMKLVQIQVGSSSPKLIWGPEFSVPRGGSGAASIAVAQDHSAMLVWDQTGPHDSQQLMGLAFDALTMKENGPTKVLSSTHEDAEQAIVLASQTGFALLYIRLLEEAAQPSQDALLVEPGQTLFIRRLAQDGRAEGDPIQVSKDGEQVLAFDAINTTEYTLVAYRASRIGHSVDESPIVVARIGMDGSISRTWADHPILGPGAPLLLAHPGSPPWLLSRGNDAETLLAKIGDLGELKLHAEGTLSEQIPLARTADQLLAMKPVGLDWSVQTYDCSDRAP